MCTQFLIFYSPCTARKVFESSVAVTTETVFLYQKHGGVRRLRCFKIESHIVYEYPMELAWRTERMSGVAMPPVTCTIGYLVTDTFTAPVLRVGLFAIDIAVDPLQLCFIGDPRAHVEIRFQSKRLQLQ